MLMTKTGVSLTRYKPKGNRNSNGPANIGPSCMVHFILVWVLFFEPTDRAADTESFAYASDFEGDDKTCFVDWPLRC